MRAILLSGVPHFVRIAQYSVQPCVDFKIFCKESKIFRPREVSLGDITDESSVTIVLIVVGDPLVL